MLRSLSISILLCAALLPAQAHEFWLEPSSYEPAPKSEINVALRVGQKFVGDAVPRNNPLISRFALIDSRGEHPIVGDDGDEPAGFANVTAGGLALLVFRNKPSSIELEAEKFEAYLKAEGLDQVIKQRRERGETTKPSRELYSRCAKSILHVGGAKAAPGGHDRVVGLTLELVPEADPAELALGGALPVQLLFQGKPLAGALVKALSQQHPQDSFEQRTDAQGRVSLRFPSRGIWLLSTVQMQQAAAGSGADWESTWSSLTFLLP